MAQMSNPGNRVGARNPDARANSVAGLSTRLANPILHMSAIPEQMPANHVIAPLTVQHARIAARLHIAGQPGTFLTQLGPDILEIIYRALPEAGFGFVAIMPQAISGHVPAVCGFISGAPGIGGVLIKALTGEGGRRGLRLLRALTGRLLRHPALIRHMFATLLYPLRSHASPRPPRAEDTGEETGRETAHEPAGKTIELLSIMVDPAQRSQGIGRQLLHAFETACHAQHATSIQVTVDAHNTGARRFYADHGFQLQQEFRLYGRPMTLYRKTRA